jgi:HSP20 family protein
MMTNRAYRPMNRNANRNHCAPADLRYPRTNIGQSDSAYIIEMSIAGWSKEEIKIEVKGDNLFIDAKAEENKSDIKFHKRQFGKKNFSRSFILPEDMKEDGIEAIFNDGILTISISKDSERKDAGIKNITIN